MVDWTYCKNCGTVVDEFESVCTYCRQPKDWQKTRVKTGNKMKKTVAYLALSTLLLLALAGVLTTICVLMEAIYLMSGGI